MNKYPQIYQYRDKNYAGASNFMNNTASGGGDLKTLENSVIGLNPSVVTETDGEEASKSSIKMGEHNVPGTVSHGSPKS